MSDPIDRQAAIDAIEFGITYAKAIDKETGEVKELFQASNDELRKAEDRIKQLPSAQSQRKTGKWVHGKEISREYCSGELIHIEYKDYHCSECGYTVENIRWNVDGELVDRYCTVCGAQMEVEE